jgi:hypothetical protein
MVPNSPGLLILFVNERYDNYLQRLWVGVAQLIRTNYTVDSWGFFPSNSSAFVCCNLQTVSSPARSPLPRFKMGEVLKIPVLRYDTMQIP